MTAKFRSTELPVVAWDIETHLIGQGAVAPPPVCYGAARRGSKGVLHATAKANGDSDFWDAITKLFQLVADKKLAMVGHSIHYDVSCVCVARPELLPLAFKAYAAGGIFDTEIREKLLNLTTHGRLKKIVNPDGSMTYTTYKLLDLVKRYTGEDRTEDKESEDSWRKNFGVLDGLPTEQYPEAALKYVTQDATDTLQVFEGQEERVESPNGGPSSLKTQEFRVGVAWALRLNTVVGFALDPTAVAVVEADMAAQLSYDKLNLLIESGVLRPGAPPRPYANGSKNKDGSPKMTVGTKESVDTKLLKSHIEGICEQHGIPMKRTGKAKNVSTTAEFIAIVAPYDPLLAQYQTRAALQKIMTTELPRMRNPDGTLASRVHPVYDVLKETTRTSSYQDKLFASANIQNVDPRVRQCYVASEGYTLLSCDVSGMELVSLGWKCNELFGSSVLHEFLKVDSNAHGFLGAQIAYDTDSGFRAACDKAGATGSIERYEFFKSCSDTNNPNMLAFYKRYRNLAKPTGLGLPGGLGVKTFVQFAAASYGVVLDEETAKRLKALWLSTYPEMVHYFDWVKRNCLDPRNTVIGQYNGRPISGYAYFTPMGTYRAGCTYTSCCNGAALQSPAAEACTRGVWELTRGCYDPGYNDTLYGCRLVAFVHDEAIMEVPNDQWRHERCMEIARVFQVSVGSVFPGAVVRVEPALMERWNKAAETVYDNDGRLTIWQPPQEHAT